MCQACLRLTEFCRTLFQERIDRFGVFRRSIADIEKIEFPFLDKVEVGFRAVPGQQFLDHAQLPVRIFCDPRGIFERDVEQVIGRCSDREALIVDTRWNGGGWLHDQLITFLGGDEYCQLVPRGKEPGRFGGEPLNR